MVSSHCDVLANIYWCIIGLDKATCSFVLYFTFLKVIIFLFHVTSTVIDQTVLTRVKTHCHLNNKERENKVPYFTVL